MSVEVTEATKVTPELLEAFERLTPQLSRSAPAPAPHELDEIVHSPATVLLIATDSETGTVLGSLTLVLFRIPTGLRAWIEDVVVDQAARRRGVAEALNRSAIAIADARGARTIDLTSRPSREPARRLYEGLGFKPRDTAVYRYEGKPQES